MSLSLLLHLESLRPSLSPRFLSFFLSPFRSLRRSSHGRIPSLAESYLVLSSLSFLSQLPPIFSRFVGSARYLPSRSFQGSLGSPPRSFIGPMRARLSRSSRLRLSRSDLFPDHIAVAPLGDRRPVGQVPGEDWSRSGGLSVFLVALSESCYRHDYLPRPE